MQTFVRAILRAARCARLNAGVPIDCRLTSSPCPMLSLDRALRLAASRDSVPAIALVGAGGKTSTLAALCEALRPCVAAATTHMGDWQVAFANRHVVWAAHDTALPAGVRLTDDVTFVTGPGRDRDSTTARTSPRSGGGPPPLDPDSSVVLSSSRRMGLANGRSRLQHRTNHRCRHLLTWSWSSPA